MIVILQDVSILLGLRVDDNVLVGPHSISSNEGEYIT